MASKVGRTDIVNTLVQHGARVNLVSKVCITDNKYYKVWPMLNNVIVYYMHDYDSGHFGFVL